MAWKTLTADDVQTRLTAAEFAAITTAAKQNAQTAEALVASAIESVTVEVRGYVGACKSNTLGAGDTIPDELETSALALIRRYLFTRLPGMKSLFDDIRQKECDDALQRLRDTAACRFAIVPPAEPADEQPAGPAVTLVSSRDRVATREKMGGL